LPSPDTGSATAPFSGSSRAQHHAQKRTTHASEQDRPGVPRRGRAWFDAQPDLDPARLVFIEETWAKTNMDRSHGRCPRGERLRMSLPHGHWKTTTFVAGLTRYDLALRPERADLTVTPQCNPVARAINYMFEEGCWEAFTRFLDDGRICLTNNAAEGSLPGAALGRNSWLFAGSERGGDRAAFPDPHCQD
jgi:hypothetical protein